MLVKDRQNGIRNSGADLADLMAIYEANYIRIKQLVPDIADMPLQHRMSIVQNALDLHLQLIDRSRYTLTLKLTYVFHDQDGEFLAPDMLVRLYLDARVAEVLRCGRLRGRRDAEYDRNRRHYELPDKWRMNRFLQKWLGYCLRQGHRFGTDEANMPAFDDLLTRIKDCPTC